METHYNDFVEFKEWITKKYVEWRGDAVGNERSIVEFSHWLGIDKASISLWMKGTRVPGKLSIIRLARKYPEVYIVLNMPAPEQDQLDERRFKKAFRETLGEYRARQINLDDPEAEKIAIEIFERNGLIYNRTEIDD